MAWLVDFGKSTLWLCGAFIAPLLTGDCNWTPTPDSAAAILFEKTKLWTQTTGSSTCLFAGGIESNHPQLFVSSSESVSALDSSMFQDKAAVAKELDRLINIQERTTAALLVKKKKAAQSISAVSEQSKEDALDEAKAAASGSGMVEDDLKEVGMFEYDFKLLPVSHSNFITQFIAAEGVPGEFFKMLELHCPERNAKIFFPKLKPIAAQLARQVFVCLLKHTGRLDEAIEACVPDDGSTPALSPATSLSSSNSVPSFPASNSAPVATASTLRVPSLSLRKLWKKTLSFETDVLKEKVSGGNVDRLVLTVTKRCAFLMGICCAVPRADESEAEVEAALLTAMDPRGAQEAKEALSLAPPTLSRQLSSRSKAKAAAAATSKLLKAHSSLTALAELKAMVSARTKVKKSSSEDRLINLLVKFFGIKLSLLPLIFAALLTYRIRGLMRLLGLLYFSDVSQSIKSGILLPELQVHLSLSLRMPRRTSKDIRAPAEKRHFLDSLDSSGTICCIHYFYLTYQQFFQVSTSNKPLVRHILD
jgi:hypothetical protein